MLPRTRRPISVSIEGEQAIQYRMKRRCSVVTPPRGAEVHIEVRRRRSLERDKDNVRIGCVARHGRECQMTSHLRADQRQRGLGIRGDLNHIGHKAAGMGESAQPVGKHRPLVRRQGHETVISQLGGRTWRIPASAWVSGTATTNSSRITTRDDTSAGITSQRPKAMSVSPWVSFFIAGCAKFWLDNSSWMPGR